MTFRACPQSSLMKESSFSHIQLNITWDFSSWRIKRVLWFTKHTTGDFCEALLMCHVTMIVQSLNDIVHGFILTIIIVQRNLWQYRVKRWLVWYLWNSKIKQRQHLLWKLWHWTKIAIKTTASVVTWWYHQQCRESFRVYRTVLFNLCCHHLMNGLYPCFHPKGVPDKSDDQTISLSRPWVCNSYLWKEKARCRRRRLLCAMTILQMRNSVQS